MASTPSGLTLVSPTNERNSTSEVNLHNVCISLFKRWVTFTLSETYKTLWRFYKEMTQKWVHYLCQIYPSVCSSTCNNPRRAVRNYIKFDSGKLSQYKSKYSDFQFFLEISEVLSYIISFILICSILITCLSHCNLLHSICPNSNSSLYNLCPQSSDTEYFVSVICIMVSFLQTHSLKFVDTGCSKFPNSLFGLFPKTTFLMKV